MKHQYKVTEYRAYIMYEHGEVVGSWLATKIHAEEEADRLYHKKLGKVIVYGTSERSEIFSVNL